jgi:hypothetical protein
MSGWVISCRGGWILRRPLYTRKLPRLSPTGVAAKGQELPHAVHKNSDIFLHRTTVKPVTDLPVGA